MASSDREWLTLGQASEILGVHQATLRDWADAGKIPVARTPGRHRRFRRSDVEALLDPERACVRQLPTRSPQAVDAAVAHVRRGLSQAPFASSMGMMAMTDEQRLVFRDAGKHLVHLAVQFVARRNGHEAVLQQAAEIGEKFGQVCGSQGLALYDSLRAFAFFRDSVIASICPEEPSSSADEEMIRIRRDMQRFFETPYYAMLVAYDRARTAWARQS